MTSAFGRGPLYPRLLRLRHVHPNGWQRLLFWEGSFVVAGILVLADVASAWTLLALPVAVAAVVKANDVVAGWLAPSLASASSAEPAELAELEPLESADVWAGTSHAQADFDAVVELALVPAERLLGEHGELTPFATAITASGQRRFVAADDGQEHPAAASLLATLRSGLASEAASLRAVAVVSHVKVRIDQAEPRPALRIEFEHAEGVALVAALPYERDILGRVSFEQAVAEPADPAIWTAER